jgi:hypothetical protein
LEISFLHLSSKIKGLEPKPALFGITFKNSKFQDFFAWKLVFLHLSSKIKGLEPKQALLGITFKNSKFQDFFTWKLVFCIYLRK